MKFKIAIPYQIIIDATHNGGFIVTVGCARMGYSTKEALLSDLEEYIDNPKFVEDSYNKCCGNRLQPVPEQPPQVNQCCDTTR